MSRSRSWWKLLVVAVAAAALWRVRGCGGCADHARPAPDHRLASHFTRLCEIATDGVEDPHRGVLRWLRYHGDHGPDMAAAFTETLVVIERTADDEAHDARARLARDRLRAPLAACEDTFAEFAAAVADDRQASAALERATDRLGRTLGILLGAEQASLDPRTWLARLDGLAAR